MYILNRYLKIVLDWILSLVMATVVGILFLSVIMRYVFNKPLYWCEEVSVLCLVIMVFLGGAILVRQDKNVVITFVYDLFNLKTARLVRILSELLSFTMITVMVCLSWKLIGRLSISTTPTLRINEAWFGVIAFVGFCLMLFYQAQNLIALLRGKQSFPEERGPQDGEG